MPTITNIRNYGNTIVSELVDSIGTTARTYTFPDTNTRDTLEVFNIGDKNLVVNVGTQTNITVSAYQSQKFSESFTSFTLNSSSGHASFRVRASYQTQDEDDEKKLASQFGNLDYRTTKSPYIVVEGDSTAAGSGGAAKWSLWLGMALRREVVNNAVWGSWIGQVKDRLKTNVLDLHPKYCLLLVGTNNINGGDSRVTIMNDYEYIVDTLIANGIEPIILTVLPRNDVPSANSAIRLINSCLLYMCQKKSIKFVDLYNPLAKDDGTPIDYILNSDNLHPSTYGATLIMKEVLKVFNDVPKPVPNNAGYPYNLFKGDYAAPQNGVFTSATNGLGTYWTAIGAGVTTFSIETNANGRKYQVCNKTTSTLDSSGIYQDIGGVTENATWRLQGEVEFTLTDRTDGGINNANVQIILDFYDTNNVWLSNKIIGDSPIYTSGIPLSDFYIDFAPPIGTVNTKLKLFGNATSPFTLKLGSLHLNIIK